MTEGSQRGVRVIRMITDDFIADFTKPVEFMADINGVVALRTGKQAGPQDTVSKDLKGPRNRFRRGLGGEEFKPDTFFRPDT